MLPIRRLISSFGEHIAQADAPSVESLVTSILLSGMPQPSLTEQQVVANIRRVLGDSRDRLRRFDKSLTELRKLSALRNAPAVLYVLLELSTPPQTLMHLVTEDRAQPSEGSLRPTQPRRRKSRSSAQRLRSLLFSSESSDTESDAEGPVARASPSSASLAGTVPAVPAVPGALCLPEEIVVRDLVYALQGLPGRLFMLRRDKTTGAHVFTFASDHPDILVSATHASCMDRVAACGALYLRCRDVVAASRLRSKTRTALCEAVVSCLSAYKAKVGLLDRRLSSNEPLSLLELVSFCNVFRDEMAALGLVTDACLYDQGLSSMQILNRLHAFGRSGDPTLEKVSRQLLRQAVLPFFDCVKTWILHGVIEDTHDEFIFRRARPPRPDHAGPSGPPEQCEHFNADAIPSRWYSAYALAVSPQRQCSPFLERGVAHLLFAIGRTTAFIKENCRNAIWQFPDDMARQLRELDMLRLAYKDTQAPVLNFLGAVHATASRELLAHVFDRAHFAHHVNGILAFVLGRQGDFMLALVDAFGGAALGAGAGASARDLYTLSANNLLEQAVQASNASIFPGHVLASLRIDVPDDRQSFALAYDVSEPLDAVICPGHMRVLAAAFRMQLALRQADARLTALFGCVSSFLKATPHTGRRPGASTGADTGTASGGASAAALLVPSYAEVQAQEAQEARRSLRALTTRVSALQSQARHALGSLLNYVCHDTVQPAFDEFFGKARHVRSLEGLIQLFDVLVRTIAYKLLLGVEYKDAPMYAPRDAEAFAAFHETLATLCGRVERFCASIADLLATIFPADRPTVVIGKARGGAKVVEAFGDDLVGCIGALTDRLLACRDMPVRLSTFQHIDYEYLADRLICTCHLQRR